LAESRFDRWFILSAKYGLVEPDKTIAPYEKTLNEMPQNERLLWAKTVFDALQHKLNPGDVVSFVAGSNYREFLAPMLSQKGVHVEVPLEGLGIGKQLAWFKKFQMEQDRLVQMDRFYTLLGRLEKGFEGRRRMRDCTGKIAWPQMGVYFFFEDQEFRTTSPGVNRVVRVGTHAVSKGSKTTLWHRLRAHRGSSGLSRNPRGSVFRRHVFDVLLAKSAPEKRVSTGGQDQNASRGVRQLEVSLAPEVSNVIGAMTLLWLAVGDEASRKSDRSYIERNSIALLSGPQGPLDLPSPHWLGCGSPHKSICKSGLWNVNHVDEKFDPRFLDTLEEYVDITVNRRTQTKHSIAPRDWFIVADRNP
jgi:hypothetical protein